MGSWAAMTIYWKANGERDWYRERRERNERIQAEHRARIDSMPVDGELWARIFSLPVRAFVFVLLLPIRHGYGKQYLWALFFLFFVAPVLLLGGAFLYAMWLHPHAYLAHWDAFAGTHPAAASWTWLVRDLSQWMSEMK
jgi:hypothetical protein